MTTRGCCKNRLSEERIACIIRLSRIDEVSNRSTLRRKRLVLTRATQYHIQEDDILHMKTYTKLHGSTSCNVIVFINRIYRPLFPAVALSVVVYEGISCFIIVLSFFNI
jgi:hypothetical protein